MKTPELHPVANTEIHQTAHHYEQQRNNLGEEFIEEVYQCMERIVNNPLVYPIIFGNVRRCILKRFPYNLFFRIRKDGGVRVLSITHQHRQLSNWNRH